MSSELKFDCLEARDVPNAVALNFDQDRLFFAPSGWQQWSSNNSQYYSISASGQSGQGVSVFGTQNVESRIWQPNAVGSDARISLSIRADAPAPILIFGRGSNLIAGTASYQGVTVAPGNTFELRDVTNGSRTTLATVKANQPVANGWLKVTVEFLGTQATVKVQRFDTQQFLNTAGNWQTAETAAIVKAVPARAGAFVGLGRLSGNYGTAFVDNFAASAIAAPVPPPVAPSPQAPTVPPPVPVPAVPPPVVVAPSTPVSTGEGRKFDHIRIAQLAYSGQQITAVEKQLFEDTVDLVVANPSYLNQFEAADAGTRKLIYSNASNVYQELLTSWLDYAAKNNVDAEAAFYHVAAPTAFSGGSPSSTPVTWFWNAIRTAGTTTANVTSIARGTQSGSIALTAGTTLAIGMPDAFREVNVTLAKAAGAGYTGVWEYASAVNAAGQVTAWKALPILNDGTNGLKQNGRISFDPPADWARGSLGTDKLQYLRYRTVSATAATAPAIARLHGRDYVNANGGTVGTIPAFDRAADLNNDGYLNDAEYANRKANFDARFESESRLFYPHYGQMRFAVNPTHASVKAWEGEYHADYLAKHPHADGLFLDNHNGRVPFSTPVLESTANYSAESASLVEAIKSAIGNRTIVVNTSGALTGNAPDGVTRAAGIAFEEFLLRPTTANWSTVNDVANAVKNRLNASPTAEVILDSHPGNAAIGDASVRMSVLSYYYLLADADRTYLMFYGGNAPTSSWTNRWVPAAAVDVGDALGEITTFASGTDPANARLQYRVYSRSYENALTLYKPLSYALGQGTGTTAANTATTHNLGGSYRRLNPAGSMGPVITSITLRNGEGAVLMKA